MQKNFEDIEKKSHKIISLRFLLNKKINNNKYNLLFKSISEFKCNPNGINEELFLKNKSINYENLNKGRTYLIIKENKIIGFFTLSVKYLDFNNISKSKIKSITGGESNSITYSAYLIGHIAKSIEYNEKSFSREILSNCMKIISKAQNLIGGRLIYLDCADNPKLIKIYESYGFKYFKTSETTGLKQFYMMI